MEISPSEMTILIKKSASFVSDKNIHLSGGISISHMNTLDGFFYS